MYRVDAVPIDAGGRRQRGRMMGAAKAAGVALGGIQNVKTGRAIPAGFADLEATLAPEGRSLYTEVKAPRWIDSNGGIIRPAGKPSAEQLEFLLSKYVRGAIVMVAWSAVRRGRLSSAAARAEQEKRWFERDVGCRSFALCVDRLRGARMGSTSARWGKPFSFTTSSSITRPIPPAAFTTEGSSPMRGFASGSGTHRRFELCKGGCLDSATPITSSASPSARNMG